MAGKSKKTNTQTASCGNTGRTSDDGTTSAPSRRNRSTTGGSTSLLAGSPVRTSQTPDNAPESTANVPGCGANLPGSLASYDPGSSSWKTWQRCLFGGWVEFAETWPRAGMTLNGELYRLADQVALARRTEENVSSLWATPAAADANRHGADYAKATRKNSGSDDLQTQAIKAEMFPTPRASDGDHPAGGKTPGRRGLQRFVQEMFPTPIATDGSKTPTGSLSKLVETGHKKGRRSGSLPDGTPCSVKTGKLNPTWVGWLMGFPIGWTDCDV